MFFMKSADFFLTLRLFKIDLKWTEDVFEVWLIDFQLINDGVEKLINRLLVGD